MKHNTSFVMVVLLAASLVLALGAAPALADSGDKLPPVAASPQALVRFSGVVSSRPEGAKIGAWVIGGKSVEVVETTGFDEEQGPAEVGANVMVVARRGTATGTADAELEAILIRVLPPVSSARPITIRGRVTELGVDYLVVNELKIQYDGSTRIEGHLEVGVFVKVHAVKRADGYHALSILVLPDSGRIVEFEGVIEDMGHPAWTIDGRQVLVDRHTVIIGRPAVGLKAKVRAREVPIGIDDADASPHLVALTITVQNAELEKEEWTGIIEFLPPQVATAASRSTGLWVVGGRSVLVTKETEIVGTPRIGFSAHVWALRQPGSRVLVAQKIQILVMLPVETPQPDVEVTGVP